jgi:hypothetical protein
MSYAVKIEPQAADDLSVLPPPVQAGVLRQIERLAAAPSTMNTRSSTGLHTRGQLFRTTFHQGELECSLEIIFRYSQDEQTLLVVRVYIEFDTSG